MRKLHLNCFHPVDKKHTKFLVHTAKCCAHFCLKPMQVTTVYAVCPFVDKHCSFICGQAQPKPSTSVVRGQRRASPRAIQRCFGDTVASWSTFEPVGLGAVFSSLVAVRSFCHTSSRFLFGPSGPRSSTKTKKKGFFY